jgi:hypothetical protein
MNENFDINIQEETELKKDLKTFIYLSTDYGFKRTFGIEQVMLFYRDRILYYISHLVQEQNVKGTETVIIDGEKKEIGWDFKLKPVYSINILDFKLNKSVETDKYISYIKLIDVHTGEIFYKKLNIVCVELPRFTKQLDEVETDLEYWIYIIKNLHLLKAMPEKMNHKAFKILEEAAKVAAMSREEVYLYQKSYNDMNIVRTESIKKDLALAQKDLALAQKDKTIAQKDNDLQIAYARIAELEQKFGLN